jgi:hypothetical protein
MGLEPVLHQVAKLSASPQMQSQVGVPLHAAGKGAQLGIGGVMGSPVVPPKPKPVPLQGARQYSFGPHVTPPQPTTLTAPAAPAAPTAPAVPVPSAPPLVTPPTWEVPAASLALPA